MRRCLSLLVALTILAAFAVSVAAYTTYGRWGVAAVDFYVNPANADVSQTGAEAAVQFAARVWTDQSNANFQFVYAGRTNATTTGNDGRNVVIFRNTTNGSAIASTYTWSSGGVLIDSDIVFWDGGFNLFTGSSGCGGSNAVYIEDILAHEFGHALGLHHSTVAGATMYSGYSTCSQTQRTLAADDISGVQALYPPTTKINNGPTVYISAPATGTSFEKGAAITFLGGASDSEDGNLSSQVTWASNLTGSIGSGANITTTLPEGLHIITASARDSGGLLGTATTSISVVAPSAPSDPSVPSGSPRLSAVGYKVKGMQKADLTWSNLTSSSVDIYRNNARVGRVANTGARTDSIDRKGGGSYTYKVCEVGTTVCTNQTTVSF